MAEEIEIIVTATGFDKVSSGLKNTTDALKTTATEAKKTGDALKSNLNTGAAQAGQSITNLSRIAQDAPFGFIGIANNINPLVESFGRLKAETGSTGGALKALVAGLSGPAGLGLAFGAITAAITFAQIGFQAWSRGSKEAKDNADIFKKDLEALKRELNAVTDELNNFISVAESSAKLNDINIVARFEDKTEQNVLQRQAKFITISEELVAATDARRKAWDNYLSVLNQTFKSEEEYQKALQAALDVYNQANKKEKELGEARELQAAINRAATVEEQRAAAERAKSSKKSVKAVETLQDAYRTFIQELVNNQKLATLFNEPAVKKNIESFESFIQLAVKKFNARATFTIPLVAELNTLKRSLDAVKPKDLVKSLQEKINLTPISIPLDIPQGSIDNISKKTVEITNALGAALEQGIIVIGVGIGEGLAAAIQGTANFGSIFQGIFNQLGNVVQQLGEQLIQLGALAIVAKLAIGSIFTNPYGAIAAGIALVALGSLIKSTTANQNRFAVGTRNAPGGMALVGERGPELINLPRGSQVIPAAQTSNMLGGVAGGLEIYGILRGQDIYFSNKKYSATYARTT
jgi:hypothetical protein